MKFKYLTRQDWIQLLKEIELVRLKFTALNEQRRKEKVEK